MRRENVASSGYLGVSSTRHARVPPAHVRPRPPATPWRRGAGSACESHTHSARSTSLRLGRRDALGRDGRRRPPCHCAPLGPALRRPSASRAGVCRGSPTTEARPPGPTAGERAGATPTHGPSLQPTPSPPSPMPRTARRRRRAAPDTASNPPHRPMELMCRREAQALPRAALQRAHRRAAVPCGADSCANGDDDGLVVCGGVSSMS